MTTDNSPRLIDHLVFPVTDIAIARERFEKLGFVVAPDGLHPFGTENCCVFFPDGTFIEPIGIAQRETTEIAAAKGNTMVQAVLAYRFRRGVEGFSHVVLKTADASADHKAFTKLAMSAGKMVRFGRSFETPEGEKGRVSFKLAFAGDKRAPDAQFFSCEVVNPPKVDRSPLYAHANGAVRLKEIVIAEPNPSDFQYFLQDLFGVREMDNHSFGIEIITGNAKVSVLSAAGVKAFLGLDIDERERGLRHTAAVLGVKDLAKTKALLDSAGVETIEKPGRIIVAPETGQGAAIAFEEDAS